ncbi:MAG: ABC transporter ATP-binding protein [Acidimicrobiia bacterium]|nr:ABC transporter ATP-binding protein [Acidimicrobiia bacterium]
MLQCLRLSVVFEDTYALDAVNLTVHDGEIVAVMGPSGCGKTTLLRAVAGLQPLDIGTVTWDGRNLRDVPPHQRGFGFMFQDYALFPHLSVRGNVEFGLRMQGAAAQHRTDRIRTVLDTVGLTGYDDRPVHELSGGEQQRVALARTLAPAPRLILLDEPIGALDRDLREHLTAEMRAIFARVGVTALYVTHDRDEAFAIADTVAVMNRGRLVRKGTPQELWADPQHEFVARMLGFGPVLDGKVNNGWADIGWTRVATDLPDGEHRLVVPPHAIRVAADGPNAGTVSNCAFRSGEYAVEFSVADVTLSATSRRRFDVGDRIMFHIAPASLLAVHE